ncbi:MAG: hypothetical protein JWM57_2023 [Phycisphaerales bacterium]|nr:hypothetical protein [Phycisphaerales bacterium]
MERDYDNARAELIEQTKSLGQRLAAWLKKYDDERVTGKIDYGHIGSLNKTAFDLKQILAEEEQAE